MVFRFILAIDGWDISHEISFRWMSLEFTDYKSTLLQVMAWCHQATSHSLPEPMLTQISVCHMVSLGHSELSASALEMLQSCTEPSVCWSQEISNHHWMELVWSTVKIYLYFLSFFDTNLVHLKTMEFHISFFSCRYCNKSSTISCVISMSTENVWNASASCVRHWLLVAMVRVTPSTIATRRFAHIGKNSGRWLMADKMWAGLLYLIFDDSWLII